MPNLYSFVAAAYDRHGEAQQGALIEIEDYVSHVPVDVWSERDDVDPLEDLATMLTDIDGLFMCWLQSGSYRWRSSKDDVESQWQPVEFGLTLGTRYTGTSTVAFVLPSDPTKVNFVQCNVILIVNNEDIPDGELGTLTVHADLVIENHHHAVFVDPTTITDSVEITLEPSLSPESDFKRSYAVFPNPLSDDFTTSEGIVCSSQTGAEYTEEQYTIDAGSLVDTGQTVSPDAMVSGTAGFLLNVSATNPTADDVLIECKGGSGSSYTTVLLPASGSVSYVGIEIVGGADSPTNQFMVDTRYADPTLATTTHIKPQDVGLQLTGWGDAAISSNGTLLISAQLTRQNALGRAADHEVFMAPSQLGGFIPPGKRYGIANAAYRSLTSGETFAPPGTLVSFVAMANSSEQTF